jgi:hypothetical protein
LELELQVVRALFLATWLTAVCLPLELFPAEHFGCFSSVAIGATDFALLNLR